jgi:hypothetical protein
MPEQDAVVAITSGVRDMQAVLNLVWDKLLPAMTPSTLPADEEANARLTRRLAELAVRMPDAAGSRGNEADGRYMFAPNDMKLESIALAHDSASARETLVARIDEVEHRIECGRGNWQAGEVAWGALKRQPAAAAGGWSGDTFTAKICFYETPFVVTVRLKFSGNEVTVNSETNVGFGRTRQPELVGKLAAASGE